MEVKIGPEIIRSYKRLSYTTWHALAEFIDNSIQSYRNNEERLKDFYSRTGEKLTVQIEYGHSNGGYLTIRDNAMGMSNNELENALRIGRPSDDRSGLSEFGMGLKTAACWFGNHWTVKTKRLGDAEGHRISFDVEQVADGNYDLDHHRFSESREEHYTEITITEMNEHIYGGAIKRVKTYLASMYRDLLTNDSFILSFNNDPLHWESPYDTGNIHYSEGKECFESFTFEVSGKEVYGWIAILERGSRANAGLTILRRGRVIRGWPESWRPQTIYGQYEGSNDLVNQRLVGGIYLDDFGVTHTKDDILWEGNDLESVESFLGDIVEPYMEIARSYRKRGTRGAFPSRSLVTSALGVLEEEIQSSRFQEIVAANGDISKERYQAISEPMLHVTRTVEPRGVYPLNGSTLSVFLSEDLSERDPYLGIEIEADNSLRVVINMRHPHVRDLRGQMGVLNHLKSCTYEGIAQWKVSETWNIDDPILIRAIKDSLLRVGYSIDRETVK